MKVGKKVFVFSFLFILAGGAFLFAAELKASYLQNTVGWIWGGMDATGGGNTAVGWISLNSRDCDTNADGTVSAAEQAARPACPLGAIADYGVNIPDTSSGGTVTGYAWSEHLGWISFNESDLAGCPSGACRAQRTGNRIVGWARILSIRDAGANAGGWTGFIKLASSGSDPISYGLTLSGRNISGYAYSDEVGWIDFSSAHIAPPDVLQVCENSCSSSLVRGTASGGGFFPPMTGGSTRDLVACYNNSGNCTDPSGDVTGSTTWSETNNPNDAVSLSSVGGKERVTAGTTTGSESISASYSGQTANMTATVTCVSSNTCETDTGGDQVCSGESYFIDNGCGVQLECSGTRVCDGNWKEVAP